MHAKGAALNNTSSFIDDTIRPISLPRIHQRIVYNDHKRQHSLMYQSITTTNKIIANFSDLVERKIHDATMLRMSDLTLILGSFS